MGRSPHVGGRSAAGGRLGGWLPATDRRSRNGPGPRTWCVRRPGAVLSWGGSAGAGKACSQGSHPFGRPLRKLRGRLLGAAGPSQSSCPSSPACLRRFVVAVLRIVGVHSTPSSPSKSSRGLRGRNFPAALLRRLFPFGNFLPLALRVDRAPLAAKQASLPATKKQL